MPHHNLSTSSEPHEIPLSVPADCDRATDELSPPVKGHSDTVYKSLSLRLSDDLLHRIFKFALTDHVYGESFTVIQGHQYHPFHMIRTLCEVCSGWRNLIKNSPLLWGQVVYLDELDLLADSSPRLKLRLENIEKSTALLWIKGAISRIAGSWDDLLSTCWPNVEKLCVEAITQDTVKTLQRPAPNLKSCIIHEHLDEQAMHLDLENILGDAPKLRRFSCTLYSFNLSAHWLSQLTTLEVKQLYIKLPSSFTLAIWLDRLGSMPRLRHLVLQDAFIEPNRDAAHLLPTICIATLSSLEIRHNLFSCGVLLEHLDLHKIRNLEELLIVSSHKATEVGNPRCHPPPECISWINRVLSQSLNSWLAINATANERKFVDLKLTDLTNALDIQVRDSSGRQASFVMHLNISPGGNQFPSIEMFTPTNLFSLSTAIRTLEIYLEPNFSSSERLGFIQDVASRSIPVDTFITNVSTLNAILGGKALTLATPRVLRMTKSMDARDDKTVSSTLGRYLAALNSDVRRLETVDLMLLGSGASVSEDLQVLNSYEGLRVLRSTQKIW